MSQDVQQLLQSLREHGTMESEDRVFTLHLSRARCYLAGNQSSSSHRFLVALVAGVLRAGAERVEVKPFKAGYRVVAYGASLEEEGLALAYEGRASEGSYPGSTDLALGLSLALECGCETAVLRSFRRGRSGFSWRLSKYREVVNEAPPHHRDGMEMELEFPPLELWQRVVPSPMYRPEVSLLKELCRFVDRPVFFKGRELASRAVAPRGRIRAAVGEYSLEAALPIEQEKWRGALGLVPGRVHLVVQGILAGEVENSGLNGTLWHDGLTLDLSRECVRQDAEFTSLLRELAEIRLELLAQAFEPGQKLTAAKARELIGPLLLTVGELLEAGDPRAGELAQAVLECFSHQPCERRWSLAEAYISLGLSAQASLLKTDYDSEAVWAKAEPLLMGDQAAEVWMAECRELPPGRLSVEVAAVLRQFVEREFSEAL